MADPHPQPAQAGGLTVRSDARRWAGLVPGEIYAARVGRVDGAQIELEFSDRCLLADTPYRFKRGDRLALRLLAAGEQLSFQLAVPSDRGAAAREMLDSLACAAGIPATPANQNAIASLLEHGLPLRRKSVEDLCALQSRGLQLQARFVPALQRIWAAGLRPRPALLACLPGWQTGQLSQCRLIRALPMLTLPRRGLAQPLHLPDYAIAGPGTTPARLRALLRLLYGGPQDSCFLGNLISASDAAEPAAALAQLLDLLELQRLLATLDSPRLVFRLPLAGQRRDCDLSLELRPLGHSGYLQRFSCLVRLDCPQGSGATLQILSEGGPCRVSLLSGDPRWLDGLLGEERIAEADGPPDWPRLQEGQARPAHGQLPAGDYPGFAARIPAALLEPLARLTRIIYERC